MAIEISNEEETIELGIELSGRFSKDDIHEVIDQLENDADIRTFRIEITANQPASLDIPRLERRADSSSELQEGDLTGGTDGAATDGTTDEQTDAATTDSTEPAAEGEPQLQVGGAPFYLMRILADRDEWIRTKELRELIPDDSDVSEDAIGTNLWNLEDRGLVEKRPYEEDKRQTEYRGTDLGKRALERASERADEQET